ncbi:MAG: SpoIIE family protein phosphatase [Bacteroidales bacterium]
MRREIVFYFFVLSGLINQLPPVLCQDNAVNDSLTVHQRIVDSLRAVKILKEAEQLFLGGKSDSALIKISESLSISIENEFLLTEAENYKLLGDIYASKYSWQEMLTNYLKALSIFNRTGNKEKEADLKRTIAGKYFLTGLYKKSALWYEEAFTTYQLLKPADIAKTGKIAESAGEAWYFLPDDSLSLNWYLTAYRYYSQAGDTAGMIRCAQKQASLYAGRGNYTSAEEKYLWLLDACIRQNEYGSCALTCNNLGFIKYRKKEYTEALDYFKRAEEYSTQQGRDDYFLTDLYSNIAITWQAAGNQSEMLRSFNKALDHAKNSLRTDEEARISYLLSLIYFNKGDNYHADLYCRECIESAEKSGAYTVMQECYRTWSDVMEKSNDFIKALDYYEKYLSLRDSLNFESRITQQKEIDRQNEYDETEQRIRLDIAGEEISNLELKTLKSEAARRENEVKLLIKQQELDRSERERLSQSLALERERFELNKKEQEVLSLRQQQRIDSLELVQKRNEALVLEQNNRLLEAEKEQQQITIEKEKQVRQLATGLGILMALVAVMILFGLISTRKKNQKLAESKRQIEIINADLEVKNAEIMRQKDIIEQKNQSITDSIQYARRIQTAVLPQLDFLTEWGIESFIMFRPKDIVSGDFYWGKKKDSKIIIAAADCTGHGVPGAFMSMLGNAFLDEIYNTTDITDPAGVLNILREEVITALKQKGITGEARDGMDISLCIINKESSTIGFAGANNPLYLIRDNQLIKVPADKMPIGIHFTEFVPFTNHTLNFRKGDIIYLFSDGYADQFGGQKGRKFMYKPFQNLLLQNHNLPMEQQKIILEKTFDEWMGSYEQVDDVLVIGIRI